MGFIHHLQRLSLVVATAFLVLTLGATSASAASKTHNSTSRTIGTCTVITHPTAALHTVCVGASLQKAPLSHADLSYAVLTDAKLNNANLSGANLTGANLTKAVLSGANLAGVTWSGTTCPDGTNSDEVGDSCSGCTCRRSPLRPPLRRRTSRDRMPRCPLPGSTRGPSSWPVPRSSPSGSCCLNSPGPWVGVAPGPRRPDD